MLMKTEEDGEHQQLDQHNLIQEDMFLIKYLRMSIFIKEFQLSKFKDLEESIDCIENIQ